MNSKEIQKKNIVSGVHEGNNAKKLRNAARVKQDVIAAELNVSQQQITQIERNAKLTPEQLDAYCKALKIEPHFITNMTDELSPEYTNIFNAYAEQIINFNPLEKVMQLGSEKDALHKEKFDIINQLLEETKEDKKETRLFVEKILGQYAEMMERFFSDKK